MAIYLNVSSKEIIRKVFRDLRPATGHSIHDMIEWIGEALEHIGAAPQLKRKQCVLNIQDHRACLPRDLMQIQQVSINESVSPAIQRELGVISQQIDTLNANLSSYYTEINDHVTQIGNGQYSSSLTSTDIENFDSRHRDQLVQLRELNSRMIVLENTYYGGGNSSGMTPLQYGASTFHASMHCEGCVNQYATCKHTYIVDLDYIKTSFETGSVCLSYLAFPTDDQCYPLVPDDISYRDALFWYIYKQLLLGGFKGPDPKIGYEFAEQRWLHYCTQARNAANYPDIDRYQNFMDQWVRLVPQMNRDLTFFEDLNDRENFISDNI
jgi:hypothetical protein